MKLAPIRPPGSNARKARAYESDILQLRTQGYTFEAIREALALAGIRVSNSTVQREAARSAKQPTAVPPVSARDSIKARPMPPSPASAAPVAAPHASTGSPVAPAGQSGQDVAEAFARNQVTNPFIRAREKR